MVCDDEYSHDELVNGKKKMNILQLTPGEIEGEVVGGGAGGGEERSQTRINTLRVRVQFGHFACTMPWAPPYDRPLTSALTSCFRTWPAC